MKFVLIILILISNSLRRNIQIDCIKYKRTSKQLIESRNRSRCVSKSVNKSGNGDRQNFLNKNIYSLGFVNNLITNRTKNSNPIRYNILKRVKKIQMNKNDIDSLNKTDVLPYLNLDKNDQISVAIFGSTGSIGTSTLNIIRECNKINNIFKVEALYVNKNIQKVVEQAKEFLPRYICIHDEIVYEELKKMVQKIKNYNPIILIGNEGMKEICKDKNIQRIIIGIDSFQGIYSTIHAIKNNKIIGLANKESIVSAGMFLRKLLTSYTNSSIIPVDSEHSAIFQCLDKNKILKTKCLESEFSKIHNINKILLCSSGGPFQNLSIEELKNVNSEKALQHPKWKMGTKITIDSATMMNKGLEVIEAHFLFDIPFENIEIVVHKECIIHSAVEFVDKSIISQMYYPDMQIPILYALTFPNRISTNLPPLNIFDVSPLTFQKPSLQKFPCIQLAYTAGKKKNFYPTVLNAANEIANNLFRNGKIQYFDISNIIKETLSLFQPQDAANNPDDLMQQIIKIHNWAKEKAHQIYLKQPR